jgi:dCTP deaminase
VLTADNIHQLIKRGPMHPPAIVIEPFTLTQLNPNSYDLTLAPNIMIYDDRVLDVKKKTDPTINAIPPSGIILYPGELYLGATVERTEAIDVIPMINGKSSLARLGISVHQTGGFGDIGFKGHWTLEITVIKPVRIYAGMRIAQLSWFRPDGAIGQRYHGKYQNSSSSTPVQSLAHKDWDPVGGDGCK